MSFTFNEKTAIELEYSNSHYAGKFVLLFSFLKLQTQLIGDSKSNLKYSISPLFISAAKVPTTKENQFTVGRLRGFFNLVVVQRINGVM